MGIRVTARRSHGLFALVFALAWPSLVHAQSEQEATRAAARELGYSGVRAYQDGEYAVAQQRLEQAFQLLRVPSLGLWSARALVQTGKLVAAAARYREILGLAVSSGKEAVQKQAQLEAKQELAQLEPRIPRFGVQLVGAAGQEVQLSVDGALLPALGAAERRPIDPGSHELVARRGAQRVEVRFELAEGAERVVVVDFEQAAAGKLGAPRSASDAGGTSAQARRLTLTWVALGVGGAGLVFGASTGLAALAKKNSLEDEEKCRDNECDPSARGSISTYDTLRTLSTIGFVVGGASAATGAVLFFTSEPAGGAEPPRAAGLALELGLSGARLRGRF
jgi:hypothetical protein